MRRALSILCLSTLSACSSYTYFARSVQPDQTGEPRELLAYWRVTKRALWFDQSSEGVVLKLTCSTATMDFEEGPHGIMFRSDGSWDGAHDVSGQSVCGLVPGIEHVTDVKVGQALSVELWCTPSQDEFAVSGPFLPAGTYSFTRVERQKGNVDVPPCLPVAAASSKTSETAAPQTSSGS